MLRSREDASTPIMEVSMIRRMAHCWALSIRQEWLWHRGRLRLIRILAWRLPSRATGVRTIINFKPSIFQAPVLRLRRRYQFITQFIEQAISMPDQPAIGLHGGEQMGWRSAQRVDSSASERAW